MTDPDNVLRPYQDLLLTAIRELGFPEGYESGSWWQEHEWFFQRVGDPRAAASIVVDWNEPLHKLNELAAIRVRRAIRACRYQELGQWGGNPEFADVVLLHRLEKLNLPLEKRRIAWWVAAMPVPER